MGKPKAPAAPDPVATAAAQTGTNVSTAVANANLGNVNQVTPYGNLTYNQSGNYDWTDPSTGSKYSIPQFTATTSLAPEQQSILNENNKTDLNLATTATNASGRLNDILGTPFTLSGLPKAGDASSISTPNYQQFGGGPQLASSVPNAGNIQTNIAGAGDVTKSVANAGNIQTAVGNGGDITKTYGTDYGANVQQVQDALFSRLNPQIDRDRSSLETSLVNQGIRRGSDAWNQAMGQLDQSVNDQRTSVVLQAGQEQTRLANLEAQKAGFENAAQAQAYGQGVTSGQFANSAQAQQYAQNANDASFANSAQSQQFTQNAAQLQANNSGQQQQFDQNAQGVSLANDANQQMFANQNTVTSQNNTLQDQMANAQLTKFNAENTARSNAANEAYASRNQSLNEILGLASGSQVQNPNFTNTNMPSIPTTDYAGIVQQGYQNQVGAYNTQVAQRNNILGGLFGLGASAIKASDRRLKRDVRRIGSYRNGLPKYEFRYAWSDRRVVGLMSDDVRKVRPDAVVSVDGFDAVNYRKALA